MFFQIVASASITGFLGFLAWQIQRIGTRVEKLSDSLNTRMDTQSADFIARMDTQSADLNARMDKLDARMDKQSADFILRMDEQSNSLNSRMDDIMRDVGAIRIQLGDMQGQMGETKGQIVVINQRLDENEKAHAAFAESIDEIAAFVKGL